MSGGVTLYICSSGVARDPWGGRGCWRGGGSTGKKSKKRGGGSRGTYEGSFWGHFGVTTLTSLFVLLLDTTLYTFITS